jgi:hypothetical protein
LRNSLAWIRSLLRLHRHGVGAGPAAGSGERPASSP